MRHLALCVFVVLASGLVLAPGALAWSGARQAASGARCVAPFGVHFQRLSDKTYDINGRVLNYDGKPVAGAQVDWGWWVKGNYTFGGSNMPHASSSGTGSTGAFAFAGVSGGHPRGVGQQGDDLHVYYYPTSAGLDEMDLWNLDFSTNNDAATPPYSYQIQPARVNVDIANAPAEPIVEMKIGLMDAGYALSDVTLMEGRASPMRCRRPSTTSSHTTTTQQAAAPRRRSGSAPLL